MSELAGRLQQLGSPIVVSPPAAIALPAQIQQTAGPPPSRAPARIAASRPPPEAPAADVESPELAELMQRLKTTMANAERARRNLNALRDTLVARGQTVRPDLLTSIARIDSLIEEAVNHNNSH